MVSIASVETQSLITQRPATRSADTISSMEEVLGSRGTGGHVLFDVVLTGLEVVVPDEAVTVVVDMILVGMLISRCIADCSM